MIRINNKRQVIFLIVLFFIALSIRIIYLLEFHHKNPFFDTISYAFDHYNFDKGAINFSKGDLLASAPNNSYAPLYKYFLGVIYLLFGRNFYFVYLIQFAMGAVSAVLIYLIAKDLFSFRAGIIAFLGFAFYSPQIIYEGIILRAAFISFFGVLSFYLFSRLKFSFSTGNLIVSTLALSLFIQGRPNVILCIPLVIVFLYKIFYPLDRKKKIQNWVIFSSTLLLSFIPLLIQCYLVHGKFVFFDTSGPNAFIAGNLISYSGVGHDKAIVEEYLKENKLNYPSIINFYFHYIFENFTEFIKLYLRKIYYFLNDFEAPSNISIYLYRKLSNTLSLLLGHFSLFSSLGVIGMFLAIKKRNQAFLLYSYILFLSVSILLFHNSARYRIPVVPYFIIFSSYTVDLIITWIFQKKYRNAAVTLVSAIILFATFLEPKGLSRIRAQDYNSIANAWIKKDNLDEAIKNFDHAIRDYPLYVYSYHNIGQYYLIKQDWVNAKLNFTKALFLSRQNAELKRKIVDTMSNSGKQYFLKKEYENAVEIYSIIQRFDPQNVDVLLNMAVCYAYLGKKQEAKKLFESILKINPDHPGAKLNLKLL